MNTTLYMVRHAQSPYVPGRERMRGLSAEGRKAAARVAELLSDIDVHVIASSPYERAVQTVRPLAERKGLDIAIYEELAERLIAGPDGRESWDAVKEAIRRSFDDPDFALEGGESTREAQQRAIPVIRKLLVEHRGRSIVIGTHGNIMTIILNHFDGRYGYDFWETSTQPDIYRLTFAGDRLERVERIWRPIDDTSQGKDGEFA